MVYVLDKGFVCRRAAAIADLNSSQKKFSDNIITRKFSELVSSGYCRFVTT